MSGNLATGREHVATNTIADGEASERQLGRSVLQRVCALSRAGVSNVDQTAAAERKQGLVGRSDTVARLLALFATLLGRPCDGGLVLCLARDGSD